MPDNPPMIYVLWWRWHDGSGGGVLRAYTDKARAEADFAMLREMGDGRDFHLAEVPHYA